MKFKNFRELSKHDFGFALKIFLIVATCGMVCYFSFLNSSWLVLLCAGILGIINFLMVQYTVDNSINYTETKVIKNNKWNSLLYFVMTYAIIALIPVDFIWKILIILAITIPFNIFRLFIGRFLWNKNGFISLKKLIKEFAGETGYRKKYYYLDLSKSIYILVTIVLGVFLFIFYVKSPEHKAKIAKQEDAKIELIKKDVLKKIKSQEASPEGIYKLFGEGQHEMIVDTILTEIFCGDTYYTFISKDNKIVRGGRRVSEELLFTRKGHKITFNCSDYGTLSCFDNLNVVLVKNY